MNTPAQPPDASLDVIYRVTQYRNAQGHKIEALSLSNDLMQKPVKFIGIGQATFSTGVGPQKIDFSFPIDGENIDEAYRRFLDTRLATAKMIQEDIDKQIRLAKLQGKA